MCLEIPGVIFGVRCRVSQKTGVSVVGSLNYDLVFRTPTMPVPGQTILGGEFSTHSGGKGGNQAVAIGALGGQVCFVGNIGSDSNGATMRSTLVAAGVNTDFLNVDASVASGTACVLVDDEGMNMIVVAPGANLALSPDFVRQSLMASSSAVVLAQLEIPLSCVAVASESEYFILNPAPVCSIPPEILARCKVLTPNETELQGLTGILPQHPEDCISAAESLLDQGVENVVVTLGSRGSFWVSRTGSQHFPAAKVNPVDTTAAGDAFNGALAHFLAEGRELGNAIQIANCVGAMSTTRHGAQESMPSLAELKAFAGDLL